MTTEKAIYQLTDLIKDRESFCHRDDFDEVFLHCPACGKDFHIEDLGQTMYCSFCPDCGQQSNIPALKKHLDMLRQAMIQKTGGQKPYKKADDVSVEDFGTIINCIVIETMQLYLSGDLDRLEQSPCETCPYYPHDEDRKTMIGCNE